jgi:hypothetical protein
MPNCSFCGQSNHNIKNCESQNIIPLLNVFTEQVNSNNFAQLYYYLHTLNIKNLKMITIQLGGKASFSKIMHIHILMNVYHSDIIGAPWTTVHPQTVDEVIINIINVYSRTQHDLILAAIKEENDSKVFILMNHIKINESKECSICLEDQICCNNMVKLNCNHEFCVDCMISLFKSDALHNTCSLCRSSIKSLSVNTSELQQNIFQELRFL